MTKGWNSPSPDPEGCLSLSLSLTQLVCRVLMKSAELLRCDPECHDVYLLNTQPSAFQSITGSDASHVKRGKNTLLLPAFTYADTDVINIDIINTQDIKNTNIIQIKHY